jgi:hypothetical protein
MRMSPREECNDALEDLETVAVEITPRGGNQMTRQQLRRRDLDDLATIKPTSPLA